MGIQILSRIKQEDKRKAIKRKDGTIQCPDHAHPSILTKLDSKTKEYEIWYCFGKKHYFFVFPDNTVLANDGDLYVRG